MRTILLIGAGRSATVLIDYLATRRDWQLVVADASATLAEEKIRPYPHAKAIGFDAQHPEQRISVIRQADVVISMLPAGLHTLVAQDCLREGKHLLTASYVSPEMKVLDREAREKGLLFLNEMGLDPGIDHLSAMQIIHEIEGEGGEITSFESFCGGLIAPRSDNNPWGYKFTWNPRNVVLAGQAGAIYLHEGSLREVGYRELFTDLQTIRVEGYGAFEAYPNRDSLGYREVYGLPGVRTMLRGTLRKPGYCEAWNLLIRLGLTDDQTMISDSADISLQTLLQRLLPGSEPLTTRLARATGLSEQDPAVQKVAWLDLDAPRPIGLPRATPAQVLQQVLEEKWRMAPEDKDLIVMQHRFAYRQHGQIRRRISSLAVEGDDALRTAMAKTVGLPLGIAARLLLEGKIPQRGVVLPVHREIYEPVLRELETFGVIFREE